MNTGLYIGLMSGTSLDGIDAVLCDFNQNHGRLVATHSHEIPRHLRETLLKLALNQPGLDLDLLGETDAALGEVFAEAALVVLDKSKHPASRIMAIGSHGQTLRHRPDAEHPFTLQIGDANRIACRTGITTVADFRRKDIAAGGQGAPLVPAFHHSWLRQAGEHRVVLNIGGIANITCLPGDDQPVRGFDTGPGNMLMDAWTQTHLQQPCDLDGNWAASTPAHPGLVEKLMRDPFIHQSPPKSTGREHYHLDWLKTQLADYSALDPATVQASLSEFTAQSIRLAITAHAPGTQRVIVCGGGARNRHLMRLLEKTLVSCKVETTEMYGIHPDWVEAAAFAWLAKQTLEHRPGNLCAVTGARREIILGGIYPA